MFFVAAGEQREGIEVVGDIGVFKASLFDESAALLEDRL